MDWFTDMFFIILVGSINILAAIFLGGYWLKYERFPWEKKQNDDDIQLNTSNKDDSYSN